MGPIGPAGPQGARGPKGDTGDAGADGISATIMCAFVSTRSEALNLALACFTSDREVLYKIHLVSSISWNLITLPMLELFES